MSDAGMAGGGVWRVERCSIRASLRLGRASTERPLRRQASSERWPRWLNYRFIAEVWWPRKSSIYTRFLSVCSVILAAPLISLKTQNDGLHVCLNCFCLPKGDVLDAVWRSEVKAAPSDGLGGRSNSWLDKVLQNSHNLKLFYNTRNLLYCKPIGTMGKVCSSQFCGIWYFSNIQKFNWNFVAVIWLWIVWWIALVHCFTIF